MILSLTCPYSIPFLPFSIPLSHLSFSLSILLFTLSLPSSYLHFLFPPFLLSCLSPSLLLLSPLLLSLPSLISLSPSFSSPPLSPGFVPCIDQLFDENLLVGSGWTTKETVRSLAYSILADLVHHIRTSLSLPQLSQAVHVFSKNVHDESFPVSIQTMSCKVRYGCGQ